MIIKMLKNPLPSSVSTMIEIVFGVPMAITVTLLTSGDTSNLITSLSFVSILFSLIFGLFSIYVPKFIKNNTSIFTFILWVIINIAFSFSSLSVNHSSLFSIGILLAILALFVIILFYIFNKSFWSIFDEYVEEAIEKGGSELVVRALLYFIIMLSIISFIILPITCKFVNNSILSLEIGSCIHLTIFTVWFLLTGFYASIEEKIKYYDV